MSELDRIEQKYGDISREVLVPEIGKLNDLARRGSRFEASDRYFQEKKRKELLEDAIPKPATHKY